MKLKSILWKIFGPFLQIRNVAIDLLDEDQKARISQAVAAVETQTVCEIKPVLKNNCSNYVWAQVLGAFVMTGLVAGVVLVPAYRHFGGSLFSDHLLTMVVGIICVFLIALYFMGHWKWYLRIWVKPDALNAYTTRYITNLIEKRALDETKARNCVVIGGFLIEAYAHVIADTGISQFVNDQDWNDAYAALSAGFRTWDAEKITQGYETAIAKVGSVLARKYPFRNTDANEVSNEIIVE